MTPARSQQIATYAARLVHASYRVDLSTSSLLRRLPHAASAGVILTAGLVLVGWTADSPILTSILPGFVPMNPTTALAFALAGVSLWQARTEPVAPRARWTSQVCALIVVAVAVLRLGGYLLGSEIGVDRMLFHEKLGHVPYGPNRMAPNTAVNFLLIGLALLLIDVETLRGRRPAQYLTLLVATVSLLTVSGYAYSQETLGRVSTHIPMALNTALSFGVLCIGILAARPDRGFTRVLTSDRDAGVTARWLLLAAIGIPWLLGWARLWGQRAGFYPTEFGVALLIIATMVLLVLVIWWNAEWLDQTHQARERAEAALRESDERLNLALRSAGVGTWTWDVVHNSIIWDDYLPPLFGLEASDSPKRYEDCFRTIHSEDRERVAEEVRRTVEEDAPYDSEFRVVWSDGSVHVLASRGKVYRDDDGRAVRMTGVCSDITERKQVAERLQERTLQLEAANEALGSFTYSVSHDLRAPLRAIDGYSRILLEDHARQLDGDGERVLGVICDNARRMGKLIDDLLTFSRLGRNELEKSTIDMTALVHGVLDELRRLEPERRIAVRVDSLHPARADGSMMRQVVANLIGNAWKFTRDRPEATIEVGCTSTPDETTYFIRDNGAGFDMAYAGKLFGVFQRLHRAEEFDGTGVGLAIVQRIVQRHGGRAWAEGVVDRGATFYFRLPAEGGAEHESYGSGDPAGRRQLGGR